MLNQKGKRKNLLFILLKSKYNVHREYTVKGNIPQGKGRLRNKMNGFFSACAKRNEKRL